MKTGNSLTLTSCQKNALLELEGSKNHFLTGHAGTGKSTLVQIFVKNRDTRSLCPVLASTGAAAVLIGGRTFHSFFGLGTMQGDPKAVVRSALENKNVRRRVKKAETVVIDEVSMLSGPTLAAAEEVARRARKSDASWGGLRIIAVGDFAQLPPVSREGPRPWAFLDGVWSESALHPLVLKTVVRTSDAFFSGLMNSIRRGDVSRDVLQFLNSRVVEGEVPDAARLFARREPTDVFNHQRLDQLPGERVDIPTKYEGDGRSIDVLKRNAPIPEVLALKLGALVMIRMNDPQLRYVNGTIGRVVDMDPEHVIVAVGKKTFNLEKTSFTHLDGDGTPRATAFNFPVVLAWALTIHKAQGSTMDRALVDLGGLWEPGQAYVALTRVRSPEDLFVSRWNPKCIISDPWVTSFYERGCPHDFISQMEYSQAPSFLAG